MTKGEESCISESVEHLTKSPLLREAEGGASVQGRLTQAQFCAQQEAQGRLRPALPFIHTLTECHQRDQAGGEGPQPGEQR